MGTCPFCGMKDPDRTTAQIRNDHSNEALARVKTATKIYVRNPLQPDITLLVKLGSLVVHSEEMLSAKGHHFDMSAIESLLDDPEVKEWVEKVRQMDLLPVKR